jgi:hypothetical protein
MPLLTVTGGSETNQSRRSLLFANGELPGLPRKQSAIRTGIRSGRHRTRSACHPKGSGHSFPFSCKGDFIV